MSAFKYDIMRIPVSVNVRRATSISLLYLTDVILPTDDPRLDFAIGSWFEEPFVKVQTLNKQTGRLEEQRRGVVHIEKALDVITILLNPDKYGKVDTRIIFVFCEEDGTEHRISYPVIGQVLPSHNVLVEWESADHNKFD